MDRKTELVNKLKSKPGRKAAIDAFCCMCIYDPDVIGAGSWRKQVDGCTATTCPLYPYRPRSTKTDDDE